MNRTFIASLSAAVLFLVTYVTAAHAAPDDTVTLVEDGKPAATLVLPAEHGHLDLAAQELNDHIEKVTGARLPVATEGDEVEGPVVLLGESARTRAMGIDESKLPAEGFVIRTAPGALAIVGDTETTLEGGHRQRTMGALWGVYRFLEDRLGIRWFIPGPMGTVIPKADTIVVTDYNVDDAPAFPIRHFNVVTDRWDKRLAESFEFPDDNNPSHQIQPRDEWGAKAWHRHALRQRAYNAWGGVFPNHSTQYWAPRYHETHPEYFARRRNGEPYLLPPGVRRKSGGRWSGYLDYSKPEVVRQAIEDTVAWYEKTDRELIEMWRRGHPERCPNDFYIPHTPADGMPVSHTPEARALVEAGTPDDPWGRASEYLAAFRVPFCKAMLERYPDKKVVGCAYASYALPPKTVERFPENFHAMLAVMPGMGMLKEKALFDEWLGHARRWHELTNGNRLHYWQYTCWPDIKCPTFWPDAWQRWYTTLKDESLGAFINGPTKYPGVIGIEHLNHYLAWRMLWNPEVDLDALVRDYADKMYGPAADDIYALQTLIRQRWNSAQWNVPRRQRVPTADMLYGKNGAYPPEVIARMKSLLTRATKRPGLSDIQRRRVAWLTGGFDIWFERVARMESGTGDYFYAFKLDEEPTVDGKTDDKAWQGVAPFRLERYMDDGMPSAARSRLKVGWTDKYLYLAAEHDEPHMDEIVTRFTDGEGVWRDDAVDFLIDPERSRADNFHFMVNAAGKKKLIRFVTGMKDTSWMPDELQVATRRLGEMWTLEMRIPMAAMGVKPAESHRWVWNFFRHRMPKVNRFIALVPTMSPATGKMETYPELLLTPPPVAAFDFETDTKVLHKAAKAWHREERKTHVFRKAGRYRHRDGRMAFAVPADAIEEDKRELYPTVNFAPFGDSLKKPVTVTARTAVDTRLRITAGAAERVAIGGRIRTKKGRRINFNQSLEGLDVTSGWSHRVLRLKDLKMGRGNKAHTVEPGDVLETLWIQVGSEPGVELKGEIDHVYIAETTALD